jgi:hypothetical protein
MVALALLLTTVALTTPPEATVSVPPALTTVALTVPPLVTETVFPLVITSPVLVTPLDTVVTVITGGSLLKAFDRPLSDFLRRY